ncbi:MAG TPA: 50S ribosomal protein L21 [Terriglobales bacterium]|jgi:large subunit ribosomal protein L21|nr:50S ribosomal protein L21 [Terriglobales bacterium]
MYAVIRAGGKQYQVAPGDVIRVEKIEGNNGQVEFTEVLAVSPASGQISKPQAGARVVGRVVEQGRADKILVFHFKRKKQYKKLAGHRQPFTAVRITEIAFDGQKFTAPAEPEKVKQAKPAARPAAEHAEPKTHAKPHAEHKEAKHAAPAKKAEHGGHAKKHAPAKKPKKK